MELEASRALPADRETVWHALNDPEVLRRCIPGCESLERGGDGTLAARMTAKVGPVSARFTGTVALHDQVPPESYRLEFQGQGGVAGHARGEAWVRLDEAEGGGTTLHYRSKAAVGGKLAQVGARLIDASARKYADDFFDRFAAEVSLPGDAGGSRPVAAAAPPSRVEPPFELPWVPPLEQPPRPDNVGVWTGVAALAVVLIAWVWLVLLPRG